MHIANVIKETSICILAPPMVLVMMNARQLRRGSRNVFERVVNLPMETFYISKG